MPQIERWYNRKINLYCLIDSDLLAKYILYNINGILYLYSTFVG